MLSSRPSLARQCSCGRALGWADGWLHHCKQQRRWSCSWIKMCSSAPTAANSWVVPNGNNAAGSLQIFGNKCLDVTNGVDADGTKLQICTCFSGNTSEYLN
ncbi:hypothetical protein B0H11DRAFT_490544 [Mycena galericulata]|nr:hypothetical protein B0H11DRAFT_490544 [Mycena galericulata]